jgi:hypothetical protein
VQHVALTGHSFGGAVVIQAAAHSDAVRTCVPMSTQTYGVDPARELSPRCSILLAHGRRGPAPPLLGVRLRDRRAAQEAAAEGGGAARAGRVVGGVAAGPAVVGPHGTDPPPGRAQRRRPADPRLGRAERRGRHARPGREGAGDAVSGHAGGAGGIARRDTATTKTFTPTRRGGQRPPRGMQRGGRGT